MKILAIDTSTKFLSLGLYEDTKFYEYKLELKSRLSAALTASIKRALDALGWQIKDIDYFACGMGPGSFTGLRIGLATIKGLAWSLDKPVIGIPTLDILACNALKIEGLVVPFVDAKRGLVYSSVYKSSNGLLKRMMPYMLINPQDLLNKLSNKSEAPRTKARGFLERNTEAAFTPALKGGVFKRRMYKNNRIIFLGDGINLFRKEILLNINKADILDSDCWYPKSYNIINLALERIKDKDFKDVFKLQPIYLYPPDCQVRK